MSDNTCPALQFNYRDYTAQEMLNIAVQAELQDSAEKHKVLLLEIKEKAQKGMRSMVVVWPKSHAEFKNAQLARLGYRISFERDNDEYETYEISWG